MSQEDVYRHDKEFDNPEDAMKHRLLHASWLYKAKRDGLEDEQIQHQLAAYGMLLYDLMIVHPN